MIDECVVIENGWDNGSHHSLVGELADDGVELLKGEALVSSSLVVYVSAVKHLQDIVVIKSVMELLGNVLELFEVNYAVLIFVKKSKQYFQAGLGLCLTHSRRNSV